MNHIFRHYSIKKLDYLILTHGHQYYAGGAAYSAANLPIGHVFANIDDLTEAIKALKTKLHDRQLIKLFEGLEISVDGAKFRISYDPLLQENKNGNETCCVVKMNYGKCSFLITGDLEARDESKIIKKGIDVAATVLKVGHHGSKTSSAPEFLQKVSLRYAVISVGSENNFGHPNQEVLKRLAEQNIKVFRTDKNGAIIFSTDGKVILAESHR